MPTDPTLTPYSWTSIRRHTSQHGRRTASTSWCGVAGVGGAKAGRRRAACGCSTRTGGRECRWWGPAGGYSGGRGGGGGGGEGGPAPGGLGMFQREGGEGVSRVGAGGGRGGGGN